MDNFYVLVFFYEEKKYSVLKLKDAVKKQQLRLIDIPSWDKEKSIDIVWNNGIYPGNFLQFGENKNAMEKLIDGLVAGSLSNAEIPVMQSKKNGKTRSSGNHEETELTDVQESKRQKLAVAKKRLEKEGNILLKVKKGTPCISCSALLTEVGILKNQTKELAVELQETANKGELYKKKYKELKKKHKALKDQKKENIREEEEDVVKIGNNLKIERNRLALCRLSDYSKYTCDILDVVFGREKLASSVLKGIKGTHKEVLNPNFVSDILGHVASKFNINVSLVRAVIRNKLNTAMKTTKCVNK